MDAVSLILLVLAIAGCTSLAPYERETLSTRRMALDGDPDETALEFTPSNARGGSHRGSRWRRGERRRGVRLQLRDATRKGVDRIRASQAQLTVRATCGMEERVARARRPASASLVRLFVPARSPPSAIDQ